MSAPKPRAERSPALEGSPTTDGSPALGKRTDPDQAASDLQRVRELLFGEQQRGFSEQLAQLQVQFAQQLEAQRRDLLAAAAAEAASARQRLEAAIAETNATWQQRHDALRQECREGQDQLQETKLDRDALAGLLGGLASRLVKGTASADR